MTNHWAKVPRWLALQPTTHWTQLAAGADAAGLLTSRCALRTTTHHSLQVYDFSPAGEVQVAGPKNWRALTAAEHAAKPRWSELQRSPPP